MATFVPAKRGVAYRTWVSLVAQATRPQFQSSPTLAAGDVQVSKDGGALANLTTLPVVTPAASVLVQVDLSATEMTADLVMVVFRDAAGAQWDDLLLVIPTVARQIDDLAFPTVSGRSLDVSATGEADANVTQWLGTAAATPTVAGVPEVDVTHVGGTLQTAGDIMADTNDIQARLPAALVGGRIAANAEVVGDKTGYALASAEYTALVNLIYDELTAEARTAGSYGQLLKDNLNATVSSRATQANILSDATPFAGANINATIGSRAIPGDAMALTAAAVDAVHDEVFEGTLTLRQIIRLVLAAVAGKSSGFPAGPAVYRDNADLKARITATVDADGNRSAVTLDGA